MSILEFFAALVTPVSIRKEVLVEYEYMAAANDRGTNRMAIKWAMCTMPVGEANSPSESWAIARWEKK